MPTPKNLWRPKCPQKFFAIFDNFRLWSRISPERINISKIWKAPDHLQPLPRYAKKPGVLWSTNVKVIRPPGTPFRTGLCFARDVFFISPRFLRDPSTDRPETLPHDQNLAVFYWLQKFGGRSPKKIWGPKTCKISVNFGPLPTLTANISGTRQRIQNRKDVRTSKIPPAFDEKSPVNFGPLTAWNYMLVWTH